MKLKQFKIVKFNYSDLFWSRYIPLLGHYAVNKLHKIIDADNTLILIVYNLKKDVNNNEEIPF
jgi:hypothetical protein